MTRSRWIDESLLTLSGDHARVRRDELAERKEKEPWGASRSGRLPDTKSPTQTDSPYRSKLEFAYSQYLDALVHAGEIVRWQYEPMTLHLGGGVKYKPDFVCWMPPVKGSGSMAGRWIQIREVKGSWIKNRRDGITRLKLAAVLFPYFGFLLVSRSAGQWEHRAL